MEDPFLLTEERLRSLKAKVITEEETYLVWQLPNGLKVKTVKAVPTKPVFQKSKQVIISNAPVYRPVPEIAEGRKRPQKTRRGHHLSAEFVDEANKVLKEQGKSGLQKFIRMKKDIWSTDNR